MDLPKLYFDVINFLFDPLHEYVKFQGITTDSNIVYDNNFAEVCVGDMVYKGDPKKRRPIVLYIHGGGFVAGDKRCRKNLSEALAERGYFVYNINYRLAKKDKWHFPTSVEDIISALNFLPVLQQNYNFDLNNIILAGDSGGGFLAGVVYSALHDDEYRIALGLNKIAVPIGIFAPFCAPFSIYEELKKPGLVSRQIAEFVTGIKVQRKGRNLETDFKYYKQCDLLATPNKNWHSIFLVYSRLDYFCKGSGEAMCERLDALNIDYTKFFSTKLLDNHSFHLMLFSEKSKQCLEAFDRYVESKFEITLSGKET